MTSELPPNPDHPGQAPETEVNATQTQFGARAVGRTASKLQKIGRYHLKRVIATGGMGTVYEAIQENPRRSVAVKVMKQGIASPSALRRFEFEAQLLGRLRHPGIAQVYEAGTHDDGEEPVPYFAMEYIPGAKLLTHYAEEKKQGTRERLMLFLQVCDGVHHGHQKGIIHRDLKPGNILVDSQGQVKIIDFGVARSTDSDMAVTTLQTQLGQLVGTLQYMSPEQCEADPHDIDTRSDVYALGVVLYQLLSGKLPYDLSRTKVYEGTRIIREQTPSRLATADAALKGDIETIVLKALEKDRERRYQSAADLRQDIQRYLNNEPISARPPSLNYQIRIFARRHRGFFVAVAVVFATLLGGVIVSTVLYFRADLARVDAARERDRAIVAEGDAQTRRAEAEAVTGFLSGMLASVDPTEALGQEFTVKQMLEQAAEKVDAAFRAQPMVEARLRATIGTTFRALGKYQAAEPHLRSSLKLRKERLGEENLEVADAMTDLAALLDAQGDYNAADHLFRDALRIRRKLLGEVHEQVAESLTNVGIVLWRRGDFQGAESLWCEALAMRRELLGDEHPLVADSLSNLGAALRNKGEIAAAEQLYREALALRRKLFGNEHPFVAESLNNLGLLLRDNGEYAEAEAIWGEALAMRRKMFGEEHPEVAQALRHLAIVHLDRGDLAAAESTIRQALAMEQKLIGDEHVETAHSRITLARILQSKGEAQAAESEFRRSLAIFEKSLPASHWVIAHTKSLLGGCQTAMGRYAEAEPLLLNSESALKRVRGAKDRHAVDALKRIIELYDAWGMPDKAAELRATLPESIPKGPKT